MNNNTAPHTPATPIVTPAKDAAVGQTPAQAQKTMPVDHAPKVEPIVAPTPKI